MLNFSLCKEVNGTDMPGTVVALPKNHSRGATDISTEDFLRTTYPTAEVSKAVKTVKTERKGDPVILMDGRGKGKKQFMKDLYHVIVRPSVVEQWLADWAVQLDDSSLSDLKLASGFMPILGTLSEQEYSTIGDLLFDRHPKGQCDKGQFESSGTSVPARSLMVKMVQKQSMWLIPDEFQTWFDSQFSASDSQDAPECARTFMWHRPGVRWLANK